LLKQIFLLTTDTKQFTSARYNLNIKVMKSREIKHSVYMMTSTNFNSVKKTPQNLLQYTDHSVYKQTKNV